MTLDADLPLDNLPPLEDKQRAFAEEYLSNGFNGTKAAQKAKYGSPRQAASRLLSNANVRAYVDARLKAMTMSTDEILGRLTEQGRGTLDDFLDATGDIDLKLARRNGKLHLLKTLTVTKRPISKGLTETTVKIEIHDPQSALVHLGRANKLFTDKTELAGSDGNPISIKEIIVKKTVADDE